MDEIIITKETANRIRDLLSQKDERVQKVVSMRVEGFSYSEIALEANISESSARVASDDSTAVVSEHIMSCESCRAEFEMFKNDIAEQLPVKDQKIISAIRRSILITRLVVLISGAVIGVALSNSMSMFYNFIIMPLIGSVSFIVFKRRWYLAPVAVFMLSYLSHIPLNRL